MRILVACEESQAVTIEGRAHGHEIYSCDIQDCSGGHPEWHIKGDVIPLLNGNCRFQTMDGEWHEIKGRWDMIIGFPYAQKRQMQAQGIFSRAESSTCSDILMACAVKHSS